MSDIQRRAQNLLDVFRDPRYDLHGHGGIQTAIQVIEGLESQVASLRQDLERISAELDLYANELDSFANVLQDRDEATDIRIALRACAHKLRRILAEKPIIIKDDGLYDRLAENDR